METDSNRKEVEPEPAKEPVEDTSNLTDDKKPVEDTSASTVEKSDHIKKNPVGSQGIDKNT